MVYCKWIMVFNRFSLYVNLPGHVHLITPLKQVMQCVISMYLDNLGVRLQLHLQLLLNVMFHIIYTLVNEAPFCLPWTWMNNVKFVFCQKAHT